MALVAILTPIKAGRADRLREHLRGLQAPFAGIGTHFARFVVLDAGGPQLLFSAKCDGDASDYLVALAQRDAAVEIWGHCRRPDPCTRDTLLQYLLAGPDRVEPDYVIDMFAPTVTVAAVNSALRLRAQVAALAARSAALDATALAHEFRQLASDR